MILIDPWITTSINCILSSLCLIIRSKFIYEVIIVEDNSPDGTLEVAKKLQKIFGAEKIIILPRPGKMGLGSAYIDGLKLCTGEFVFLMDADMSHHPKQIPEFIRYCNVHYFTTVCLVVDRMLLPFTASRRKIIMMWLLVHAMLMVVG